MPSSYSRDHFPVCIQSDMPVLSQKYVLQAPGIHNIIDTECVKSLNSILNMVITKPGAMELCTNFKKAHLADLRADKS